MTSIADTDASFVLRVSSGGEPPASPRRHDGFSLLECVVALALIGCALLIATALLNSMTRAATRAQAQTELLRASEATLEMIRGGARALESGSYFVSTGTLPNLEVSVTVEPTDLDGLYDCRVTARCEILREQLTHTLVTRIWRPR